MHFEIYRIYKLVTIKYILNVFKKQIPFSVIYYNLFCRLTRNVYLIFQMRFIWHECSLVPKRYFKKN